MSDHPIPATLITYYLEMRDYQEFRPVYSEKETIKMERLWRIDLPYYRFLYWAVGDQWRWRDRLHMADEELEAALKKAQVFVMYFEGAPAGYVELLKEDEAVEISYLGIRPAFMGAGLGKHLLSYGIEQAWQWEGSQRVWLHTCNLDSPHALDNYLKRGFRIYKEEEEAMPTRYMI